MFDYDPGARMDVHEFGAVHRNGCTVHDINYASPLAGRVPAYLVVPEGVGPYSAVVYMHPGQGDRSTFLAEAEALAPAGMVSLLIAAPFRRPEFRSPSSPTPDPAMALHLSRQIVMDIRRGVDLLIGRPEVSADRIAYVGHSFGATWGGPLAGVERRIRAFVLMAGYPSLTEWHRTSDHPFAVQFRSRFAPEEFDLYLATLAPLDGIRYIHRAAPAALFFQFARQDEFVTVQQAEHYFTAASEPKEVLWYDTDHLFTTTAAPRLDRARWLATHLEAPAL